MTSTTILIITAIVIGALAIWHVINIACEPFPLEMLFSSHTHHGASEVGATITPLNKAELTEWFEIAVHGQPRFIGWWECSFDPKQEVSHMCWWDGENWYSSPSGELAFFGNFNMGECYRGLAHLPVAAA